VIKSLNGFAHMAPSQPKRRKEYIFVPNVASQMTLLFKNIYGGGLYYFIQKIYQLVNGSLGKIVSS